MCSLVICENRRFVWQNNSECRFITMAMLFNKSESCYPLKIVLLWLTKILLTGKKNNCRKLQNLFKYTVLNEKYLNKKYSTFRLIKYVSLQIDTNIFYSNDSPEQLLT
jgi:hypothetical protein